MGRLGDLFPDDERRAFLDRQLKPGQVLYLYCEFINPQKDKYLVLARAGSNPLLFMINSRIPRFIAGNPALHASQVKLPAADYTFLDHDSFVDCSRVIDWFDSEQIRQQIGADVGRLKGELSAGAKQEIVEAVTQSRTLTPRDKELIVNALK